MDILTDEEFRQRLGVMPTDPSLAMNTKANTDGESVRNKVKEADHGQKCEMCGYIEAGIIYTVYPPLYAHGCGCILSDRFNDYDKAKENYRYKMGVIKDYLNLRKTDRKGCADKWR